MIAPCSSSSIKWGANEIKVTKNLIGLLVVLFDIAIVFTFWCSMIALKSLQDIT